MSKVVYIISDVYRSMYFEWLVEEWSKYSKAELQFILINCKGNPIDEMIAAKGYKVHHEKIDKKWSAKGMIAVRRLLKSIKPTAVHCHLMKANLHGLPAARLAGISCRIYTRHHSTFHIDFHPKWKQIDKLMNKVATGIVAISKNVRQVLEEEENVPLKKIIDLPHGFKLEYFRDVNETRIQTIKNKWALPMGKNVGVISRFIQWKGICYIVEALKIIAKEIPDVNFVFLNATGPDEKEIKDVIASALPEERVRLIPFEDEMPPVYANLDAVIHTPIDAHIEAFGQVYVEALAAGVPLVCSLSGIASEFIEDKVNAMVVPYKDPEGIVWAVKTLFNNAELANSLTKEGFQSVERFSFENHMRKLVTIYG